MSTHDSMSEDDDDESIIENLSIKPPRQYPQHPLMPLLSFLTLTEFDNYMVLKSLIALSYPIWAPISFLYGETHLSSWSCPCVLRYILPVHYTI